MCKRLSNRFGFPVGNTIQSLLFGLLHGVPFGMMMGKPLVYILLTLFPTMIAFAEGWFNEKRAGGSIVPSWIFHSILNILSALSGI